MTVIFLAFGVYAQTEFHKTITIPLTSIKTISHTYFDITNQERTLSYIQCDNTNGGFLLHDANPSVMTVNHMKMPSHLIVNEFDVCQDSVFFVGDSVGWPFFGSFSVKDMVNQNVSLNIRWLPYYALLDPVGQQYTDYVFYRDLNRIKMYYDQAAGTHHVLMLGRRVLDRYNPGILPNPHSYDTVGCILDFKVGSQTLFVGYFVYQGTPYHKEELDDIALTEQYVVVAGRIVYNNHKFDTVLLQYYDRNGFSLYNYEKFYCLYNDEQYVLSNLRIDSCEIVPDAIVMAHYAYHAATQSSGMTVNVALPSYTPNPPITLSNNYQPQTYNALYNIFNPNTVLGVVWNENEQSTYVLQKTLGLDSLAPLPQTALVRLPYSSVNSDVMWDANNYYTSIDRRIGYSYLAGGLDYNMDYPSLWSGHYATQCGTNLTITEEYNGYVMKRYSINDVVYQEFCPKRQYVAPVQKDNRIIDCVK